jgi:uncharacterized protein (TIGR02145 family)
MLKSAAMRIAFFFAALLATAAFCQQDRAAEFADHRDGKKYRTVKIGDLTWMAENLNYNASGSKCYDNKLANCDKYGRLYNWETAMAACPKSWHLPNNAEWDRLYRYADSTSDTKSPYSSKMAGKFLKAKSGWNDNGRVSGSGEDIYGFSALPVGLGSSNGGFSNAGNSSYWWSASDINANYANFRYMLYFSDGALYNNSNKLFLFSIRCVRD